MAARVIDINETRLCSLEQIKVFLDGTPGVQFRPFEGDDARYAHIKVGWVVLWGALGLRLDGGERGRE